MWRAVLTARLRFDRRATRLDRSERIADVPFGVRERLDRSFCGQFVLDEQRERTVAVDVVGEQPDDPLEFEDTSTGITRRLVDAGHEVICFTRGEADALAPMRSSSRPATATIRRPSTGEFLKRVGSAGE